MLDLTDGEIFVVAFIVAAVVSAPWWPRAGAAVAVLLSREAREAKARSSHENDGDL